MSRSEQLVLRFSHLVDEKIRKQIQAFEAPGKLRRTWPGWNTITHENGLTYASTIGVNGSYKQFPFVRGGEHMWQVSQEAKIGKYSGKMAVATFDSTPDRIIRCWTFDSAVQGIHTVTRRQLVRIDQLEDALSWATSPHEVPESFQRLAELSNEETIEVDHHLAELSRSASETSVALASLARARRRPIPHLPVN